jgi:hypothetical protein
VWLPDSARLACVAGTFQEPHIAVSGADGTVESSETRGSHPTAGESISSIADPETRHAKSA